MLTATVYATPSVVIRLLVEEDGQATTEYGLIIVLVSIIAMACLQLIGVKVTGLLQGVASLVP